MWEISNAEFGVAAALAPTAVSLLCLRLRFDAVPKHRFRDAWFQQTLAFAVVETIVG